MSVEIAANVTGTLLTRIVKNCFYFFKNKNRFRIEEILCERPPGFGERVCQ